MNVDAKRLAIAIVMSIKVGVGPSSDIRGRASKVDIHQLSGSCIVLNCVHGDLPNTRQLEFRATYIVPTIISETIIKSIGPVCLMVNMWALCTINKVKRLTSSNHQRHQMQMYRIGILEQQSLAACLEYNSLQGRKYLACIYHSAREMTYRKVL